MNVPSLSLRCPETVVTACTASGLSPGSTPTCRRSVAAAVVISRSSSHRARNTPGPSLSTVISRGSSRLPAEKWKFSGSTSRPPSSKHPQFSEWKRLDPIIPHSFAAVCHISADTILRKTWYIHCTARKRLFNLRTFSFGFFFLSRVGARLTYVFPFLT